MQYKKFGTSQKKGFPSGVYILRLKYIQINKKYKKSLIIQQKLFDKKNIISSIGYPKGLECLKIGYQIDFKDTLTILFKKINS